MRVGGEAGTQTGPGLGATPQANTTEPTVAAESEKDYPTQANTTAVVLRFQLRPTPAASPMVLGNGGGDDSDSDDDFDHEKMEQSKQQQRAAVSHKKRMKQGTVS